jgi:response regulator RpfG family c-di-GMP phosphodiesterase
MLPELKALEASLKQILYGCVEHVHATKAALYLSSSHDLNAKRYEIVTSYQYNPAGRQVVSANDDLVDRLAVKRAPFFVNGLGADQRLAEVLFQQGNDRLLVTPLFSRGRLLGFIDMRDKAGKKPFDTPDLGAAKQIADQMLQILATNKLFGLAPIALSEAPSKPPPANYVMPTPVVAPPPVRPGGFFSNEAMKSIETARAQMSKRQLNASPTGRRSLGTDELDAVRLLLPAALAIPSVTVACFSAVGHLGNPQLIASIDTVTAETVEMLQRHLHDWLRRANQPQMMMKAELLYPFGQRAPANGIATVLSAPVNQQSLEGLVLTFAFGETPDAQTTRALQLFLRQVELSIESTMGAATGRNDRQAIAEKLLEPDFQKYPELADHSREVSVVADRFARVLELPASQVETVRLAALVHDVGLRLLDYERLYKRLNLTAEEMRGLAEHPVVGAALVEPLLGGDVAQAVLRHHERVDGKGYPSRMGGNLIPLAARIIQIADAWVAMTAPQSYQPTILPNQAMNRLREGAGSQFDGQLVERFLRDLHEIVS